MITNKLVAFFFDWKFTPEELSNAVEGIDTYFGGHKHPCFSTRAKAEARRAILDEKFYDVLWGIRYWGGKEFSVEPCKGVFR